MPVKIAWYVEGMVLGCQFVGRLTRSELLEANRQLRARMEACSGPVHLLFALSHTARIPANFYRLRETTDFLTMPNCGLVLLYEHDNPGAAQLLSQALTATLPWPEYERVRHFSSRDAAQAYLRAQIAASAD